MCSTLCEVEESLWQNIHVLFTAVVTFPETHSNCEFVPVFLRFYVVERRVIYLFFVKRQFLTFGFFDWFKIIGSFVG